MPTTAIGLAEIIWRHPSNRGHRFQAFGKTLSWQLFKRLVRRPIRVRAFGSMRFIAYPDSTEPGRLLYFGGIPDYHEMWFMDRLLRPGDRVIDGGANAGLYTLLAAKLVGAAGHVDAFEAAPGTAARLRENVELNRIGHVEIHQAALAAETGVVAFTTDRAKDSANRIGTSDDGETSTVSVKAVALDDVLSGHYAFGKLDVEGAEPLALVGAQRLLSERSPPVWQLELIDRFTRRYGWSRHEVVDLLRSYGYELALYDADSNELVLGEDNPETRPNVLAVATELIEEVRERLAKAGSRDHGADRLTR